MTRNTWILVIFALASLARPPAAAGADGIVVGNFAALTGTAPYTQTISHSLGETPKAIICWSTRALGTGGGNSSFHISLGMSDGTSDYVITGVSDDGAAAADVKTRMSSAVIHFMNDSGTNLGEAVIDSWGTSNFTLEWTTAASSAYRVHYLLIGGSGISADVSLWDSPTSTGTHSVTGVGFEPDAVLHLYSAETTSLDSTGNYLDFGFGVMEASGDQWAMGLFSNDGADPTNTYTGQQTNRAIYDADESSVWRDASYVSMDSDGFTLSFHTVQSANKNIALSLAGIAAHADSFTKSTSAAPVSQEINGHAFVPTAVIFSSFLKATNASPVADAAFAIGASDGSAESSAAAYDEDNLATANSARNHQTAKTFVEVTSSTSSLADLTSFDHDGYTLNWTTNSTNAIEICSLALAPISAVEVRLEGGEAIATGAGVELWWRVTREVNNVGFHVVRERNGVRERINRVPIAGSMLGGPPRRWGSAGRDYTYRDRDGRAGDLYTIEDLDLDGTVTSHGPWTAVPGTPTPPLPVSFGTANAMGAPGGLGSGVGEPATTLVDIGLSRDPATEAWLATQEALIISTVESGVTRVTALDWVAAGLATPVDSRALRLYFRGEEQAIEVVDGGDGRFDGGDEVLFVASENTSQDGARSCYWLLEDSRPLLDRPRRISRSPLSTAPAQIADRFAQRWRYAPQLAYFPALLNGAAPNTFADLISNTPVEVALSFEGRSFLPDAEASVTISLQGIGVRDHVVSVAIAGTPVGTMEFSGVESTTRTWTLPPGALVAPPVTVELQTSEPNDFVYLSSVEAEVECQFSVGATRWSSSIGGGEIAVLPTASGALRLFDTTDRSAIVEVPLTPVPFIPGAVWARAEGGGFREWNFFESALAPESVRAHAPTSWSSHSSGAEFLILAPGAFRPALEPLATARRLEGLTTEIVPLEEIYDEFGGGHAESATIADFLSVASRRWLQPPRYVLLVGEGATDPLESDPPAVQVRAPVRRLDGATLTTASDLTYGDVDDDGEIEMAVGRFPVGSIEDVEQLVKKTLRYGALPPAARRYRDEAVAVIDSDGLFSFAKAAGRTIRAHPRFSWTVLDRNTDSAGAVSADLIVKSDRGAGVFAFFGHGGTEGFGEIGVWDAELARLSENRDRLAIVALASCLNGYFHHPTVECLAESWLEAPRGGAIAVLASTDIARPRPVSEASISWIEEISRPSAPRLGDALLSVQDRVDSLAFRTMVLLGDPTVRFER